MFWRYQEVSCERVGFILRDLIVPKEASICVFCGPSFAFNEEVSLSVQQDMSGFVEEGEPEDIFAFVSKAQLD